MNFDDYARLKTIQEQIKDTEKLIKELKKALENGDDILEIIVTQYENLVDRLVKEAEELKKEME